MANGNAPYIIENTISIEHIMFNEKINGQTHLLEAVIYRSLKDKQRSAMIFAHSRKGPYPPQTPKEYLAYDSAW